MKKSIKEIQKDVLTLEDVMQKTLEANQDIEALKTLKSEFEFFLIANENDEFDDEEQFTNVLSNEDVSIQRYFMHTFISFLVIFFRCYEYYLIERDTDGKAKTDKNFYAVYTEEGQRIKKMYDEYLNYEIE